MSRKTGTVSSDGTDTRSASEIKAEILASEEQQAPPEIATPERAEPETPAETPELLPKVYEPKYDDSTGLPLVEFEQAEPEPVVEVSEPETKPDIGTFKSPETLKKSYDDLRSVYDKEQNKNRDLDGELQSLRVQLAEIRGELTASRQPEPEPRAPEPTSEQLAEWLTENPAGYAKYVEERATRVAEARVSHIEQQLDTERSVRIQRERAEFALREIPEIRAIAAARGDESKMEPAHIEFVQRYTSMIQKYPDMAQSNDKMELAANAVRQTLYKEHTLAEQTRAPKSPAKPPQPASDVFLESASGRAATTPKKRAADMTAAEIKRQLIDGGVPVIDRG